MVESVKELEAELETLGLGDIPPLLQAHAPIYEAGCAKVRKESGRISKRKRSRLRECRGIDPVIDVLILQHGTDSRHPIRALVQAESTCIVLCRVYGKLQPCMRRKGATLLPTPQNRIQRT